MQEQKLILQRIFWEGIERVMPKNALELHLRLEKKSSEELLWLDDKVFPLHAKKIVVLGAGKGVAAMAKVMEDILGERISDGLVITKYAHALPLQHIKVMEAGHPIPDDAGVLATTALLEKAQALGEDHLLICLLTGGGSALTPAPAKNLNLEQIQETTAILLRSGATIQEINAVRKHLSVFSGGQFARAAQPAQVLTLIISDVIGDPLDVIASGPTAPDDSTYQDCLDILNKYAITAQIPQAVLSHLENGIKGIFPETPKAEDAFFSHIINEIVATNKHALQAMTKYAQNFADLGIANGFEVHVHHEPMQGEAQEMAKTLITKAKNLQNALLPGQKPICLLAGGETTVSIKGQGMGGRNQEMALTAALALENHEGIFTLFAGTDGTDGPTDANGGFAHAHAAQNMRKHLDPQDMLDNNDSYAALTASDDLFVTGPTLTNVMDVAIVLIYPQ